MQTEDGAENKAGVSIVPYLYLIIGVFLLFLGIWQWYDLFQAEQGLKFGSLSVPLLKIYNLFGKWGVSGVYFISSLLLIIVAIKKLKKDKKTDKDTLEKEDQD